MGQVAIDSEMFTLWLWLTVRHGIDGPFIDGLPKLIAWCFSMAILNNQMFSIYIPSLRFSWIKYKQWFLANAIDHPFFHHQEEAAVANIQEIQGLRRWVCHNIIQCEAPLWCECWFRFARETSSLFAYHFYHSYWSYKPTNWTLSNGFATISYHVRCSPTQGFHILFNRPQKLPGQPHLWWCVVKSKLSCFAHEKRGFPTTTKTNGGLSWQILRLSFGRESLVTPPM